MKSTFNQHIGIFEDAVPKEWCNRVIELFEQKKENHISRQQIEKGISVTEKSDLHSSLESLDPTFPSMIYNLYKSVYPMYATEYKLSPKMMQQNVFISGFKVQKTLPTEGYHVWHFESASIDQCDRFMVYTLYLNDVEEGGETEFLLQSKRIPSKQGTMCLFPAGFTHIHRGNPPLSGPKYIITGWVNFADQSKDKPNE